MLTSPLVFLINYGTYLKCAAWEPRRRLQTVGDGDMVIYTQAGNRGYPGGIPQAEARECRQTSWPPRRHGILPAWGDSRD